MRPNLLFLVEVDLPSGTQPTPELAEEVARLLRSTVGNVAAPPVAIGAVVQPVIASWDYRCTERREHLATDLGARGGTGGEFVLHDMTFADATFADGFEVTLRAGEAGEQVHAGRVYRLVLVPPEPTTDSTES